MLSLFYRFFFLCSRRLFYREQAPLLQSELIIVGSFLAGGAGKTPYAAWLAGSLVSKGFRVAVICHKAAARDEVPWLRRKLSGCTVLATRNRAKLTRALDGQFDYFVWDDGLEDRRIAGARKIVLRWGERAERIADLIPGGKCRSLEKDHRDISETIRCGDAFETPDIRFYIAAVHDSLGNESSQKTFHALCGLGNPERFFKDLENFGFTLESKTACPDHDRNFRRKADKLLRQGKSIIMSEKDAERLSETQRKNPLIFVTLQELEILKGK
ncbi:MAG: tetraacyldisaccharide 4'-kinase [Fibrobacter sp.]|nr:tetraacyldisaccharide 4'-kinase [Fibrobacter sp.]